MALYSFQRFFVLLVFFQLVSSEDAIEESSTLGCNEITCDVNTEYCTIVNGRPICAAIPRPTCADQPCNLGSTCVDIGDRFVCVCGTGQTGFTCDVALSSTPGEQVCADSDQCAGDCKCVPSSENQQGYQCVSASGFVGENCDIATPAVICGSSEIMISISNEFYEEYDSTMNSSYMFLSPDIYSEITHLRQCEAAMINNETYSIKIPLPFTNCGTTASGDRTDDSDNITFSNRLWSNIRSNGLYDMPIAIMDFSCVYAKEYAIVSSLQPVVENQVSIVFGGTRTFDVNLELCKMPSLMSRCPDMYRVESGAVYTIGQTIHVNVFANLNDEASSASHLAIPLVEMYLSCSPIKDSLIVVKLVENGCPTEPGFELKVSSGSSNSSVSSHVAFQLPRAPFCATHVYIHAAVRICASENLVGCDRYPTTSYCLNSISKRSASSNDVAYNIIGPLTILEPKHGRDDVTIIADERHRVLIERKRSDTPRSFNDIVEVNVLVIGIVIFTIWMIFLLVIGLKFCLYGPTDSDHNAPLL